MTTVEPNIILSLHPEWWPKILFGEKTLEIRKTAPHPVYFPLRVLVYLTTPVCKIVGEFTCETARQIKGNYDLITEASCLRPGQLEKYADGKIIRAWEVSSPIQYEKPRELAYYGIKRAPQSWCYLENSTEPMDDVKAIEVLSDGDAAIRYQDRRRIASTIENLRAAAYQSSAETEQLRQTNVGLAKEAREAKNYGAALENCLRGMCWCCEWRKYSCAKLHEPTIECTKKKMEIPKGARVASCEFWKFKVPEVPK